MAEAANITQLKNMGKKMRATGIAVLILGVFVVALIAKCLVNIPADQVGVVIKKIGDELPGNEVVATKPGFKGVQQDVLKPGWYILNPLTNEVQYKDAVIIEQGMVGIVNNKTGKQPVNTEDVLVNEGERGWQKEVLAPGVYLINPFVKEVAIAPAVNVPAGCVGVVTSLTGTHSNEDLVTKGQRGVWREVLRPGTYRMNTKGFHITVHKAVVIEAGYVGVLVRKTGDAPKIANAVVVARGERGVQPNTLPPGLHYLNPYEFDVIPVDRRVQKYEMSGTNTTQSQHEIRGDDRLAFPSSDGFEIKVDTSIQWQIENDRIPEVVATLGNITEIISTIIRPNAREIGRLEGSKLKAEDFINGDNREKFVTTFSATLKERCARVGILVSKALVRAVFPPVEVSQPLKDREVAMLMLQTNAEKQRQAKSEAALEEERSRIQQKKDSIHAETAKIVAQTNAQREKEVAKIKAEQLQEVARIQKLQQTEILEKQKLEADGIRALAEAEAYRARSLIQADGALDKKLRAWTDVMKLWANNPNLVPRIVVGGSGGDKGSALTGQELIMQLLAIERLDRFASSDIGGDLEMANPKPKATR